MTSLLLEVEKQMEETSFSVWCEKYSFLLSPRKLEITMFIFVIFDRNILQREGISFDVL